MSEALAIERCAACGHAVFPRRAVCPRCGGSSWQPEDAAEATVEQVTSRATSAEAGRVHLAAVRLDVGPVVTARCGADARPGDRLRLAWEPTAGGRRRVIAR